MSNSAIFSTVSQPLFRVPNSSHPQLEFLSLNVTMNTYAISLGLRFCRISPLLINLRHMLLHKSNIIVAIAKILLYLKTIQVFHGPKYENSSKIVSRMPKNRFFGHISINSHFELYVAS